MRLHDVEGVADYAKTKSMNTTPSHFGSYILSHKKRLMNEVIIQIVGFYTSFQYGDTHSMYIHKKYWSSLLVGKSFGISKNDYGNSGIFYARFLAPRKNYWVVTDDFGVISAKRTFKCYSDQHRMLEFIEYISLSEGKTTSGIFSIDWTKSFE